MDSDYHPLVHGEGKDQSNEVGGVGCGEEEEAEEEEAEKLSVTERS